MYMDRLSSTGQNKSISLYKMCRNNTEHIPELIISTTGDLMTKQVITNGMHSSLARLPEKQLVIAFCSNFILKKKKNHSSAIPPFQCIMT